MTSIHVISQQATQLNLMPLPSYDIPALRALPGIQPRKEVILHMPGNQYDQSQQPYNQTQPVQAQTVQENVHTAVTITTDRSIEAPSVAELQNLEQAVRKVAYGFGF